MELKGKILTVEDHENITNMIKRTFEMRGYQVAVEHNGKRGYERMVQEKYDLVILDVMLPDMDGFEICKKIREVSDVPIMMLTARGEIENRIQGLKLGAYDYMAKPFDLTELILRVEGIIERSKTSPRPDTKRLVVGNIILYPDRYEVTVKGRKVDLTPKEFDLLKFLIENKPNVMSRDSILQNVWGYDYDGGTNVVDVYIRYLRANIEEEFDERHIRTVRGVGYSIGD